MLAARPWFGIFGRTGRPYGRRLLVGYFAIHGIWCEVRAVRPAHHAIVVNRYLMEERLVPQRREHGAGKFAGEVDGSSDPVVKFDVQAVLRKRGDPDDAIQHKLYSSGLILNR